MHIVVVAIYPPPPSLPLNNFSLSYAPSPLEKFLATPLVRLGQVGFEVKFSYEG